MGRAIDILLIEPDHHHAQLIREGISKVCPPCHIEWVEAPEAAKAFVHEAAPAKGARRRLNPALIILELLDPKKPEAEKFMRWLRNHPRTKQLPVIILGVEGDAFSVFKAYDLGGSSYLVKPKDEAKFVEMVATTASYWTNLNHPPE